MVKKSGLVSLNFKAHVLHGHQEENQENTHRNKKTRHDCEPEGDYLLHLTAASHVEASKRILLVLNENIPVVFPDP
jgi:hypothetical protein